MGVLVVLFCCVWADVGIVCLIGNLACFVMWFFAGLNVDGYRVNVVFGVGLMVMLLFQISFRLLVIVVVWCLCLLFCLGVLWFDCYVHVNSVVLVFMIFIVYCVVGVWVVVF